MVKKSNFGEKIKCPNCGEVIPISEALYHQIEERAREEIRSEALEQQKAISARENTLKQKEADFEKLLAEKLKKSTQELSKQAEIKARETVSVEIEALKQEAGEKADQLAKSQEAEIELRKRQREIEDKQKSLLLDIERKLDEERKLIEEKASQRFQEQYQFRDAEKDKKLRDALVANDELRRKLEQGSQQTQGEVLELQLESLLRSAFPHDNVEAVPKGVSGADVIQYVVHPNGTVCGSIIWESKRTKSWTDNWINKLKDDQRAVRANIAVLVSQVLPKDCKNFTEINGIWVTNPECAVGLALALRASLIEVAFARLASEGKGEKMEALYEYLSGSEFKQRVEAIVETFADMQIDLQAERRTAERAWAKREKQLQRVILSTSGMYGDLQGLIGSSLKSIPALSAPKEDEENI